MAKYLLLIFIVLPFLELYLLMAIGREFGAAPTLGFLLVTALLGAALAKREGRRVLRNWRAAAAEGRVPEEGIVSGALALAGGLLLVIPGVITDVMGLFLLIPLTRRWTAGRIRRVMERRMADGTLHVTARQWGGAPDVRSPGERFEQPSSQTRRIPGEVDAEFTDEGSGR